MSDDKKAPCHHSAYQKMLEFNKLHPETKQVYRDMQNWHIKNNPANGIFCPTDAVFPMSKASLEVFRRISHVGNVTMEEKRRLISYIFNLTMFGTWRNTLGVYRVDPDIFEQVLQSPIPDETPTEIFERLPEWCVYVELPNSRGIIFTDKNGVKETFVRGFWALFDHSPTRKDAKKKAISIYWDTDVKDDTLMPMTINIREGLTIAESVSEGYKEIGIDESNDEVNNELNTCLLVFSLLLWLCAEEPDITDITGQPLTSKDLHKPKFGRNKKTGAFVPPNQPIVYNIGKRLGGEIRAFNEKNTQDNRDGKTCASSRKRPHIRRGHWHGVWRGTGQNKSFHIYWQPAVFVNAGY